MPALVDLTGQRFGRLVVIERADNLGAQAGWQTRCDCGTTVTVRGHKLRSGETQSCGCLRADTCGQLRRQDVVDYAGAHDRLRVLRGPARTHACVDCGQPAQSWSYDRLDPNELTAQNNHGQGLAYSLDPSHYQPRCTPCHAAFDAPSRKAN